MTSSFHIETQQRFRWCWAAVAYTVAHYFFPDSTLTQCDIAKAVIKPPAGDDCCDFTHNVCDETRPLEDVLDVLNNLLAPEHLNNTIAEQPFLPPNDLKAQIDMGRPVCARVQWFGNNGSHFVMVAGYSETQDEELWLDVFDPYYEDSTIPYKQFVTAYLDAGTWSETYLVGQP